MNFNKINEDLEDQNFIGKNEHIMGRKLFFKLPVTGEIVSVSYCQIFQFVFGKFNINLSIILFL